MSTMQAYTDGSRDYRQMYRPLDLRGPLPYPTINRGTVLDFLVSTGLTEFLDLLNKAGLSGLFNSQQLAMTVFVPIKVSPTDNTVDLVKYHLCERVLSPDFMMRTPYMKINTRLSGGNTIVVENIPDLTLNHYVPVLDAVRVGSSQLYIIPESLDWRNPTRGP